MGIFLTIGYFIVMFLVAVAGVFVLNKYVYDKVSVNKYIPLAISIIGLVSEFAIRSDNLIITSLIGILAVFAFAWYWSINQTGNVKIKPEKKIIIKSKAKPNRAKNINKNK